MKKWLTSIGLKAAGIVVALTLFVTLGVPALSSGGLGSVAQKALLTIGLAGEAYAVTPDYEVDGTADDVQVQAALNALPVTGGRLILFAGNYNFAATVSRAINNVTIEGDGKGTFVAYNAVTATFSAGTQTGWVFKDFRTDAGWLTLASDTILAGELWNGTALVSNVVVSGSTMPASPVEGQQFIQDTTGRQVLFTYNGTSWFPIRSFGTMTVYVDSTDGTDAIDKGTGVDAAAYKTIQYTVNMIPRDHEAVNIYINGESYAEDVEIRGKYGYGTSGLITFIGTTSSTPLVATGGTLGSGNVTNKVTGAFAVGAHDNKLIRFTSGANIGHVRVVGQTTAGVLYLDGRPLPAAPVNLDTYEILDWSTTVQSFWTDRQDNIKFQYLHVEDGATPLGTAVIYNFQSGNIVEYCYVKSTGANSAVVWADNGWTAVTDSVIENDQNSTYSLYAAFGGGVCDTTGARIIGNGANQGAVARYGGTVNLQASEILDTWNCVDVQNGGQVHLLTNGVTNFLHGANDAGVRASNHGQVFNTDAANVTYATLLDLTADANAVNEWAEAASFSYID